MPQSGKLPVLNLLTGQKSVFIAPQKLHRFTSNLAGPTETWVRFAVQNFEHFRGFYTPNSPTCLKFHVICITDYGVITEKSRVRQLGQFFRAPCRKNYALDQKVDDTFLTVSTSSISKQSLGKIAQCAPAVGAKMWCMFCFVLFLFVTACTVVQAVV